MRTTACSSDQARFADFYAAKRIDLRLTLVVHPKANGKTEIVNKAIQKALKKKLDGPKDGWVKELLYFLWEVPDDVPYVYQLHALQDSIQHKSTPSNRSQPSERVGEFFLTRVE